MKSLEKRIQIIEDRVKRLRRTAAQIPSFPQYQASQDIKDIAERNLQVAIEACLDIARIITAKENLREPGDQKGIFAVLAENRIISDKTLSFLVPMAGTRNILVHNYDRIDDSIMYGILKRHLDDFTLYLNEIKTYSLLNPTSDRETQ
jgi:uncharacterized protein YutE (UPF0331/DUF86 family)